jgi:hypothetical protein
MEIAVNLGLHHAGEIEFDVTGLGEARAVAQKPEFAAVGREAPNRVRKVQVLLNCRVGAAARAAALVQSLVGADDIDGRRGRVVTGSVGDIEALIAGGKRALEFQDYEAFASDGGGGFAPAFGGSFVAMVECGPIRLRVGECPHDLVG